MPGKQDASHKNSHGTRKWSSAVTTDSTHPRLKVLEEAKELLHHKIVAGKERQKKGASGKRAA
jgi:hypothetical protein